MSKNDPPFINEEEKDSTTKKDTGHTEITVGFVATDSAYQSTQKAKAKFVKMKSDIIKAISKKIKERKYKKEINKNQDQK